MSKVTVRIVRVTVMMKVAIPVLYKSDQIIKKSRKTRYDKCTTCNSPTKSVSLKQEQALIARDVIIVCWLLVQKIVASGSKNTLVSISWNCKIK